MILRKTIVKAEISDTPRAHWIKPRTYLNLHISAYVITYIISLLVLSTDADEFRFHRPWPGRPIFKPIPPPGNKPDKEVITSTNKVEELAVESTPEETEATVATAEPAIKVTKSEELAVESTPEDTEVTVAKAEPDTEVTKSMIDEDTDADEYDNNEDNPYDDKGNDENAMYDEKDERNYLNDADSKQLVSNVQKTPQEELDQMIEGLGTLLSNKSAVVTVGDVSDAFDQMDALLSTDDDALEFPCTVLTALDALGARADLNGSTAAAAARQHVAVVMADSAPGRPVRGLRVAATDNGFTDAGLQILQDGVDSTILTSYNTEAVVTLPASLAQSSRRISFVVFGSDRAFLRHDSDQYEVNSKIISVNVENFTQMENGEVVDIHLRPSTSETPRNMTRACVYWHFAENGTGYWSQDGCIFIESSAGLLDMCRCTHLTHFAEILVPKNVFSEDNETALEIISLIGCFLSLFGLLGIALTAILFRSWRNDFNNKVWLQLTIALLINVISFLIIVFSRFEYYSIFCMVVGVLLHYAVLASFCWMLVAGIISYRKLVIVFARNPKRRLLKASAFSWLFPLVVVATLVFVAPQSYTRRFGGESPMGGFCYPSDLGLWLTVFAPITIVVASNWIIFVLIIRSVFGTKKIQKHGDSSEMIRRASVSCLLVFLFGLPWVFGLFAYNIVAAYLFTLTTSYQGFVLFIFFVIINTKTRGMWMNKLRIKKKAKTVTSSLTTSRNAPASNESEQSPFIESSSTRTNVTSLMSNSSDGRVIAYNVTSGSAVNEDSLYNSKDSDIDSFKTAKSHDNFSEDEIFKSVEGITDVIENEKENIKTKSESTSNISTSPEDSDRTDYKSAVDFIIPNQDDGVSTGITIEKLKNEKTSNKDGVSENLSNHEVVNNEESISPEITIYSVPTQNASLII